MSGNILYKAQSQDEDALVNAAARLHMVLISKNGNSLGKLACLGRFMFDGVRQIC